ncbi:AraC family transcriptional regulator [Clostridium beijerinckii]|uniref:AraC family transcriptional regulator n=1 Tax=Clostridium beijerinckii TaxID=1520 RepID=UPI00232AABA5|nr:AraC family transcriptional regulator [Clostridium beijerinckii]
MPDYFKYVLKGIDFIENNIKNEINISDIASEVGFSRFHFIRIFKVMSNDTIFEYIRKRRLTSAAIDLIETNLNILDIAFKYVYNSQEAFTRVFQNYYGLTPKKYRTLGVHLSNLYKPRITEEDLKFKNESAKFQYKIMERKEFYIVGMKYTGRNSKKEVPKLFNEFVSNMHKIDGNIIYDGLYSLDTCNNSEEFTCLVGVEISNIYNLPEGMDIKKVKGNKYAIFDLPNNIEDIPFTINNIYYGLVKQKEIIPINNYVFEFYDKNFEPNGRNGRANLYIPIE